MKNCKWYLALVLLAAACPGVLTAEPVYLLPATTTVLPGEAFSLEIRVNDVADLYAYSFDIAFDPAVLTYLSITEGNFLPDLGSTIFIPGTESPAGYLAYTSGTLTGPIAGVTGSGLLATVSFVAGASGTTVVELANVTLLDSGFGTIDTGVTNGQVTIGSAVPEPGTALLLLAGLGLLGWLRRRVPN